LSLPNEKEAIMYSRVNIVRIDPARLDEGFRMLRERALPALETMPGLEAAYVLRAVTGTAAMSVLLFESEAALKASEQNHAAIMERAKELGIEFVSTEEYEVVGSVRPVWRPEP
jgi:heme-degrading monooxygenase HmoA